MTEHKVLETKRLILRPWKETDAESLYKYAKDPDVGPIAGWPPHTSVENSLKTIREVFSVPETYAICLKGSPEIIGCIGLKLGDATDMTDRDDECELGYWLGKPFWGRGIMPEAAKELIRHGFEDLSMRAIWCGYYDGNMKSKRVQEKCGFCYHHTAEGLEVALMGEVRIGHANLLSKEQWEENRNKIRIVKATEDDAEELLEFMKQIGSETDNLTFGPEGFPASVESERNFIQSVNTSTSSVMMVAKMDDRIVGTSGFMGMQGPRMKHRGEISISVLKDEWGKGVGSKLFEAVLEFAKTTANAEIVSLEVRSDNERAIRLYEKFGFRKHGCFPGFSKIDGEYVDFDLMSLRLNETEG